MRINDLLFETYSGLNANRVRSGLTILGIVIGIASVIAMVSIGEGTRGTITNSIEGLGSNLLTVTPGAAQQGRGFVSTGRGGAQTLKNEDADSLATLAGVAAVSPEFQRRTQITSDLGNNTNTTAIGVTPGYQQVRNVEIDQGSFISSDQIRSVSKVAVLGPTAATDLFGDTNPIGRTIRINKINFKVIGILVAKGGTGFFSPDETILIPLSTMQKIVTGADYLSTIAISVTDKDQMNTVKDLATTFLTERHKVIEPDFSIVSQADILGTLSAVTNTFTIFLASIAGISLVVGGIGIMNMMLTAVTERTREIGLRKAIGAKRIEITLQFLLEAVLLTLLGGFIGIALGTLVANLVSQFAGIATAVSIQSVLLATGVSGLIGVVFGFYPARRAAGLHPIQALRYE